MPIVPIVPPLLDDEYDSIRQVIEDSLASEQTVAPILPNYDPDSALLYFPPSNLGLYPWAIVTAARNVTRPIDQVSLEDEVSECFQAVQGMSI